MSWCHRRALHCFGGDMLGDQLRRADATADTPADATDATATHARADVQLRRRHGAVQARPARHAGRGGLHRVVHGDGDQVPLRRCHGDMRARDERHADSGAVQGQLRAADAAAHAGRRVQLQRHGGAVPRGPARQRDGRGLHRQLQVRCAAQLRHVQRHSTVRQARHGLHRVRRVLFQFPVDTVRVQRLFQHARRAGRLRQQVTSSWLRRGKRRRKKC